MMTHHLLKMYWIYQLSIKKNKALLPHTKNGKSSWVPLSRKVLVILEGLSRDNEQIFPITDIAVRQAWDRLRKRTN